MAADPTTTRTRSPWAWVPSLYYAEGLPYVVVMILSVILYKRLGVSNTDLALYTSWLYLPWVIKPFWAPLVEVVRTKRLWIVAMQLVVGAGLAGVALTIPAGPFFQYTLAFLWLLAFSSATHDIAADGFYLLALDEGDQSLFVGIRSTFYRAAMLTGQGLLVVLAGTLEVSSGLPPTTVTVSAVADTPAAAAAAPPVRTQDARALHIIVSDELLALPLAGLAPAQADTIKAQAHAANVAGGHVPPPEAPAADADGGPSWWTTSVSQPLGAFLTRTVGKPADEAPDATRAGAVGAVSVRLSAPPPDGQEQVVNVALDDGAKEVTIAEGERLSFTAANWDQPARVVFALDSRLRTPREATFRATSGDLRFAWATTFWVVAGLFVLFALYHQASLPKPASDAPRQARGSGLVQYLGFLVVFVPLLALLVIPMLLWGLVGPLVGRREAPWGRLVAALPFAKSEFSDPIVTFFAKPGISVAIAFILLYRFAEAQLGKMASPFLLDGREAGGLALTTGEVGVVYGTVGLLCLTLGGILGGVLASRDGLRRWFWPMVVAINLPNAVYIYLSMARPDSILAVNVAVAVEQFGYGFGFTAFLLVLIHFADGPYKTAHYAICTGFMALGMMIPGMFSGWLQTILGYERFFLWVLIATVPSFLVAALVTFPADFGKKTDAVEDAETSTTDGAAIEA